MNQTEQMREALRKAYALGQKYWQQADSDYESEQKKSDATYEMYKQLVEDTVQALAAEPAPAQPVQPAVSTEQLLGAVARGWCHERNKHKVMDTDLAYAIAEQVEKLFQSPNPIAAEPAPEALLNGLTQQETEQTASCLGLLRKTAPLARLTRYETAMIEIKCADNDGNIDPEYFANELQDAMIAKNGGKV